MCTISEKGKNQAIVLVGASASPVAFMIVSQNLCYTSGVSIPRINAFSGTQFKTAQQLSPVLLYASTYYVKCAMLCTVHSGL